MLRLVFSFLLLFTAILYAEDDGNITTPSAPVLEQKVLYVQYKEFPQRIIKGEVFSITLKVLNLLKDSTQIKYHFKNNAYDLLTPEPIRQYDGNYYLDTFYFQLLDITSTTPSVNVTLVKDDQVLQTITLPAQKIETISLNPKNDFCNIIAKDLTLVKSKTTEYDQTHNIVVFIVTAKQARLGDFHLNGVYKQGFESLNDELDESRMVYYAVIDKKIDLFSFSYFNIEKNKYITLSIPIIVDDDKVTTQSDLKPKDQSKQQIKIFIALGIVFLGIVLLVWQRKWIYIVLIIVPAGYIGYIVFEQKNICVKEGAKVTILPLYNSTVFEILPTRKHLQKLGDTKGYIKIELENKKIGWVSEEDICTY